MEIKLVKEEEDVRPKIAEVIYGSLIQLEGSIYMKMSKKVGAGININWTSRYCILTNLRYGTMRQIKAKTLVTVLHTSKEAEMFKITDRKTVELHLK